MKKKAYRSITLTGFQTEIVEQVKKMLETNKRNDAIGHIIETYWLNNYHHIITMGKVKLMEEQARINYFDSIEKLRNEDEKDNLRQT
tara:strand:- start:198 stop:458 length:261 start_codon:yes stop_codon:yes gene_type:complete